MTKEVNQWTNQQSTSGSMDQPTTDRIQNESITSKPINGSMDQSTINQRVNGPIKQSSTDQSTDRSTNQSITQKQKKMRAWVKGINESTSQIIKSVNTPANPQSTRPIKLKRSTNPPNQPTNQASHHQSTGQSKPINQ